MPLLVYRPSQSEFTHENEEFRKVCKVLKRKFRNSDNLCVLAGNMNVFGKEYDGFIITPYSIILLEFKDFGGYVIAAENGNWVAQNGERYDIVKGGSSRKNPFDQARTNRSTFISALVSAGIHEEAARKMVALILFNKSITIENHISEPVQRWLHIADVDHLLDKIEDIVNPSLDLSNEKIEALIEKLDLRNEFLDHRYSDVEFFNTWKGISSEPVINIPESVENYVELIHKAKRITASYSIFDCTINRLDVPFELTKQYLVKVELEPTEELLNGFQKLSIPVFSDGEFLYWALGDEIPTQPKKEKHKSAEEYQLVFRKSSTRIPAWLEDYLFVQNGCVYKPDHERFSYNADLNPDEVKIYAGTYLPRSYAENFLIYDNLLENDTFRNALLSKESISIVSLGAGTGGDVMGIISAITKHDKSNIPIKIFAVDESRNSLDFFENLVHRYLRHSKRIVTFSRQSLGLRQVSDLEEIAVNLHDGSIDVFTCSKAGCEFVSKGIFGEKNPYEIICNTFKSKLSASGIFSFIDVTIPTESGLFIPQILNAGINSFVKSNPQFSSVLPQSCCCYEQECDRECFYKQEIIVHHCKKSDDLSKICYRILSRKDFCDRIVDGDIGKKFVIGKNDDGTLDYCKFSVNNEIEIDAFNVNN